MSNLLKRVLVGVVGIPLIIFLCYLKGIPFLILSVLISSLALWEFYSMLEVRGFRPIKELGVLISDLLLIVSYFVNKDILFFEFIFFIIIICAELLRKENQSPVNPMILVFGLLYITIPFIMLRSLLEIGNLNLVIVIFILIWICDTAAYFGGRSFGKHKLSQISPNKTWEGSISGFLFTMIAAAVVYFLFPESISLQNAVITGMLIGIFAQAGDLFESLIKRYCGVKDSSDLIPGHGGILDRFDSLIFVAPVVFIYFTFAG